MKSLISRALSKNPEGLIQNITPESAGWKFVGFDVFKLLSGKSLEKETHKKEVCLVILSGKASVITKKKKWSQLGERESVFSRESGNKGIPPYAVYIPNEDRFKVEALTDIELAVCSAPGKGNYKASLLSTPTLIKRGKDNNTRFINNIAMEIINENISISNIPVLPI